jgi:hypothetical protein
MGSLFCCGSGIFFFFDDLSITERGPRLRRHALLGCRRVVLPQYESMNDPFLYFRSSGTSSAARAKSASCAVRLVRYQAANCRSARLKSQQAVADQRAGSGQM